jgi:hypothetical protein
LVILPSKQVVQTDLEVSEVKGIWDWFKRVEVILLEGWPKCLCRLVLICWPR